MDVLVPLVVVAVVIVTAAGQLQWVTVFEYQHALRYRDGRLKGVLPPGRHLTLRRRDWVTVHDARPQQRFVAGQEVLTADGIPVKVSLLLRFELRDPVVALHEVGDPFDQLHADVQIALREHLAGRDVDDVLADRQSMGPAVLEAIASSSGRLGLTVTEVAVRDLMLPGAVKDLFAKVVQARKEGEATLEAARAETASLRSLANAARLVDQNPGLLSLRALQAVAAGSGNTIVVDTSGNARPAAAAGGSGTDAS